jgi:hypothetical protein
MLGVAHAAALRAAQLCLALAGTTVALPSVPIGVLFGVLVIVDTASFRRLRMQAQPDNVTGIVRVRSICQILNAIISANRIKVPNHLSIQPWAKES